MPIFAIKPTSNYTFDVLNIFQNVVVGNVVKDKKITEDSHGLKYVQFSLVNKNSFYGLYNNYLKNNELYKEFAKSLEPKMFLISGMHISDNILRNKFVTNFTGGIRNTVIFINRSSFNNSYFKSNGVQFEFTNSILCNTIFHKESIGMNIHIKKSLIEKNISIKDANTVSIENARMHRVKFKNCSIKILKFKNILITDLLSFDNCDAKNLHSSLLFMIYYKLSGGKYKKFHYNGIFKFW